MNTRKPSSHEETIIAFGREFTCRFEREAGGSYRAICRDFPDTVAFGATLDEARAHVRGELNFWLDAAYPPEYPATSGSGEAVV
jgi:predicted RNase H-like HicB family nuclease